MGPGKDVARRFFFVCRSAFSDPAHRFRVLFIENCIMEGRACFCEHAYYNNKARFRDKAKEAPLQECRGANAGEDTKGIWRMPRRQEPKKDAASCEKLRGDASSH